MARINVVSIVQNGDGHDVVTVYAVPKVFDTMVALARRWDRSLSVEVLDGGETFAIVVPRKDNAVPAEPELVLAKLAQLHASHVAHIRRVSELGS